MIFFSLGKHVSKCLKERGHPPLSPEEIRHVDEALKRTEAVHGKMDEETLTIMAAITVALYSREGEAEL